MQVLGRLRAGPTSVGKLQRAEHVRLERGYRPGCCRVSNLSYRLL